MWWARRGAGLPTTHGSCWRCCAGAQRDSHHPQRAQPSPPSVHGQGSTAVPATTARTAFVCSATGISVLYTASLPASSLLPQLLMATSSCRRVAGIAHTQHKSNFPRTYLLTPKMFQICSLTSSGHTWAFSACEARAGRKTGDGVNSHC